MSKDYAEILKEFWDRYELRMDKSKGDYLIEDGVNPEWFDTYNSQDPKVLFVLKESNESEAKNKTRKSIFDKNGWFGRYSLGNRSKGGKITIMLAMYFALKNIDTITVEEMINNKHNINPADDIKEIAFININKHGNGGLASDGKYTTFLYEDADLLAEQIDFISPDIIVLGSKDDLPMFKKNILGKLTIKKPHLINTKHFSYSGFSYNEFLEEARVVLKKGNE